MILLLLPVMMKISDTPTTLGDPCERTARLPDQVEKHCSRDSITHNGQKHLLSWSLILGERGEEN